LLTVKLDETMSASKNDNSTISRDGSLSAKLPAGLFGAGAINLLPTRPDALSTTTSS
jgi:hypothetical protein